MGAKSSNGSSKGGSGAWKIAYADFMTAMMAFFLLLWLLSLSESDKLPGIADYFTPTENKVPLTNIGGEGVLKGSSPNEDDLLGESVPVPDQTVLSEAEAEITPIAAESEVSAAGAGSTGNDNGTGTSSTSSGSGAENPWARLVKQDAHSDPDPGTIEKMLEAVKEKFEPYEETIQVHESHGNITIEVIDLEENPMFATGSAEMTENNIQIAGIVAEILAGMGGQIMITGHTDSVPYGNPAVYSNWELSADRANAMRRAMIEKGVTIQRIARISGAADTVPLNREVPDSVENRRVSIEIITGLGDGLATLATPQ